MWSSVPLGQFRDWRWAIFRSAAVLRAQLLLIETHAGLRTAPYTTVGPAVGGAGSHWVRPALDPRPRHAVSVGLYRGVGQDAPGVNPGPQLDYSLNGPEARALSPYITGL